MNILPLLAALIREIFSKKQTPREPEPMVMDHPDNVIAFKQAGDSDGLMSGVYFFNAVQATRTLHGCQRVVDLGCGAGSLLVRLAKLNPEISFLGLDFSDEMLKVAQQNLKDNQVKNVELKKADFTDLHFIADHSFDGVISTLALHHMPSFEMLRRCFRESNRILKPGGALFFSDLGRLKSLISIVTFAYENRDGVPFEFNLDSERSYRAAFLPQDFSRLAVEEMSGRDLQVSQTWGAPLMMILKSKAYAIPDHKLEILKSLKADVQPTQKRDITQLQIFFKWGGLDRSNARLSPK